VVTKATEDSKLDPQTDLLARFVWEMRLRCHTGLILPYTRCITQKVHASFRVMNTVCFAKFRGMDIEMKANPVHITNRVCRHYKDHLTIREIVFVLESHTSTIWLEKSCAPRGLSPSMYEGADVN
jgi:hypothetical protein